MKLSGLESYDKSWVLVRTIVIAIALGAFGLVAYMYNDSQNRIFQAFNQMRYLDGDGNVFSTRPIESKLARMWELEDHVKDFYTLFYQLDEYTYHENIIKASELAGQSYKYLVDNYEENEVYEKIKANNLQSTVKIDSVFIDMNEKPIKGLIYGVQTIRRNKGEKKRRIDATFEMIECSRSKTNVHGAKIENWKIINDEAIDEN